MFYKEKILSIRSSDRVLEIGPGSTPHHRSDAFLELEFDTHQDKVSQRGGVSKEPVYGNRPVYFYDGTKFPFRDNEFDYVICSHVIEHVVDPVAFLNEVFRVGTGRGYIEYPLITYEQLYDFDVHLQFVKFNFDSRILMYLPKSDTTFTEFSAVRSIFYRMLECGWDDLCAANKETFFEGFEFDKSFLVEKSKNINALLPNKSHIKRKSFLRRGVSCLLNRVNL